MPFEFHNEKLIGLAWAHRGIRGGRESWAGSKRTTIGKWHSM